MDVVSLYLQFVAEWDRYVLIVSSQFFLYMNYSQKAYEEAKSCWRYFFKQWWKYRSKSNYYITPKQKVTCIQFFSFYYNAKKAKKKSKKSDDSNPLEPIKSEPMETDENNKETKSEKEEGKEESITETKSEKSETEENVDIKKEAKAGGGDTKDEKSTSSQPSKTFHSFFSKENADFVQVFDKWNHLEFEKKVCVSNYISLAQW